MSRFLACVVSEHSGDLVFAVQKCQNEILLPDAVFSLLSQEMK